METPATAERRRRGFLGWTVIVLVALAILIVVIAGVGRLAVLTPAGRELVTSFIEGKEIGRQVGYAKGGPQAFIAKLEEFKKK